MKVMIRQELFVNHLKNKFPDKIDLLPSGKRYGMLPNFIRTLQACKGEYIALCEGDDYWTDENKLQKQVNFLELNKNFAFCYHACSVLEGENLIIPQEDKFSFEFGYYPVLYGKLGKTVSMMFRRADLNMDIYTILINGALIGDWPMELLLLAEGNKKGFL